MSNAQLRETKKSNQENLTHLGTTHSLPPILEMWSARYSGQMGGNLLTVQSLILMSYFFYFWAPFFATYRCAMPKLATFSENIWAPHGIKASIWTISSFYIALLYCYDQYLVYMGIAWIYFVAIVVISSLITITITASW